MANNHHKPEEMVAKLRQVEVLAIAGLSQPLLGGPTSSMGFKPEQGGREKGERALRDIEDSLHERKGETREGKPIVAEEPAAWLEPDQSNSTDTGSTTPAGAEAFKPVSGLQVVTEPLRIANALHAAQATEISTNRTKRGLWSRGP